MTPRLTSLIFTKKGRRGSLKEYRWFSHRVFDIYPVMTLNEYRVDQVQNIISCRREVPTKLLHVFWGTCFRILLVIKICFVFNFWLFRESTPTHILALPRAMILKRKSRTPKDKNSILKKLGTGLRRLKSKFSSARKFENNLENLEYFVVVKHVGNELQKIWNFFSWRFLTLFWLSNPIQISENFFLSKIN